VDRLGQVQSGPLISGLVYTGCGCQLPHFKAKNRTGLDFKTLAASMSRNEEEKSSDTIPSTTLVIAWGCHRYIRNKRCRSNKVKYEEKEGKPHNLLSTVDSLLTHTHWWTAQGMGYQGVWTARRGQTKDKQINII
jgi:hypothetical protein